MPLNGAKTILLQACAIVVLGAVIGIVDSMARPIQIGRAAPPPLQIPPPPAIKPPNPGQQAPAPQATPPSHQTPAPTPPNPSTSATPNSADCALTPKDKLPAGHITIDEAKALHDARDAANPAEQGGPGAVFVDTRKNNFYEEGHVAGAVRIELHDFASGDPPVLAFIDRSATIITYCVGGNCDESEAVARQLSMAGYQKVYVMHDGFPCWKSLGHPSETGPGAFP